MTHSSLATLAAFRATNAPLVTIVPFLKKELCAGCESGFPLQAAVAVRNRVLYLIASGAARGQVAEEAAVLTDWLMQVRDGAKLQHNFFDAVNNMLASADMLSSFALSTEMYAVNSVLLEYGASGLHFLEILTASQKVRVDYRAPAVRCLQPRRLHRMLGDFEGLGLIEVEDEGSGGAPHAKRGPKFKFLAFVPDHGVRFIQPLPVESVAEEICSGPFYQQDAPSCVDCGAITVRNGACYECTNCKAAVEAV